MKPEIFLALVAGLAPALAYAAPAPTAEQGGKVFGAWCAPCHGAGPGHPGTAALAAKYKGAIPGELEKRGDSLPPALIKVMVRQGVSVMPSFRKTEVSDAELEAIVLYLKRSGR